MKPFQELQVVSSPQSQMATKQDPLQLAVRAVPVCICREAQGTEAHTQVEQLQTPQLPGSSQAEL